MIFKHEFEIDEDRIKGEDLERFIAFKKRHFSGIVGEKIGETFDWKKLEEILPPRWKLEIVAYPIDKWSQFLVALKKYIQPEDRKAVWELIQNIDQEPTTLTNEQH